jgi:hypothetical protein
MRGSVGSNPTSTAQTGEISPNRRRLNTPWWLSTVRGDLTARRVQARDTRPAGKSRSPDPDGRAGAARRGADAPRDERLLRYQNGRRITDRRQGGETGTVR